MPLSVLQLNSGKEKRISETAGSFARYVPIGYILYVDDRAILQALPFDVKHLEAKGAPFPLVEDVRSFDISATGTLLCRRGKPLNKSMTVQWIDETGKMEPIIQMPGEYGFPRLSPDGNRLALTISDGKERGVSIHDLERRTTNRLTFGDPADYPEWMPDGKYLLFHAPGGIFLTPADGSAKPRRILETDGVPESISPDGHTLALSNIGRDTQRDISLVSLRGQGNGLQAGKPEPLINGPADEINRTFSPDGKWLAYSSNLSGDFRIYVRSMKNRGANWQVSSEGGFLPQWSPNAEEIFFKSYGSDKLWAASYSVNGETFVPGSVRPFGGSVQIPPQGSAPIYAISSHGNRVAAVLPATEGEEDRPRPKYTLMVNFFNEIKRHDQVGAR